jgi:hypothetical protein
MWGDGGNTAQWPGLCQLWRENRSPSAPDPMHSEPTGHGKRPATGSTAFDGPLCAHDPSVARAFGNSGGMDGGGGCRKGGARTAGRPGATAGADDDPGPDPGPGGRSLSMVCRLRPLRHHLLGERVQAPSGSGSRRGFFLRTSCDSYQVLPSVAFYQVSLSTKCRFLPGATATRWQLPGGRLADSQTRRLADRGEGRRRSLAGGVVDNAFPPRWRRKTPVGKADSATTSRGRA